MKFEWLCAIAALAMTSCGSKEPPGRPNVLLISIDTVRADHLSCYGYERETSPTLDRLAKEGVRFERTFSTSSLTLPAHYSLFTGLEVSAHGVCSERLWAEEHALEIRGSMLAERFSAADYATGGFHTSADLDASFELSAGFETYERVGHSAYTHPLFSKRVQQLRDQGDEDTLAEWMRAEPELFSDHREVADEAVDAAIQWIAVTGERNYFCFLHLVDARNDYAPPPPFDTKFDPDYSGSIDGRASLLRAEMTERDLEHVIALYDGEIAWVDSQIKRLLEGLDELGKLDNTLVVVTSDHGEEFFEHGGKLHGRTLHTESLHVPWILWWPAGLESRVRIEESTGIVDIAPTLGALCELESVASSGRDVSPLIAGDALPPRELVSELLVFGDSNRAPTRRLSVLRGSTHILAEANPKGLTSAVRFDLDRDPRELGSPEPLEPTSLGLESLRSRLGKVRLASRDRASQSSGSSESASGQSTSSGGDSDPTDSTLGSETRLCLDGCLWPDQ